MKTVPFRRVFRVFDFDVEYEHRPNPNIYQATVPKEITISVDADMFDHLVESQQEELIKKAVLAVLEDEITFDTPDTPEFEISDVDFLYEEADY